MTPQHVFYTLLHLNYVPAIVISIIGFAFGGLWYSPLLFSKAWMAEVKLPGEQAKAQGGGATKLFFTFLCTLVATIALDVLISERGLDSLVSGAKFGLFVGVGLAAALHIPAMLFEGRTCRYRAIVNGHTVLLCILLSAILGIWH
jgi:hypothetical protein